MNHSVTLLILNGYLSVLSCCAFIIFAHYLIKNYREGYVQMRPAIALAVLWVGEIVLRAPLFYARAKIEAGYVVPIPNVALIIGGLTTIIALLCVIRVFSPAHWGNKSWVSAFLLASFVVWSTINLVK